MYSSSFHLFVDLKKNIDLNDGNKLPCKLFTATIVHSGSPGKPRAYALETTPNAPFPITLSIAKFPRGNSHDLTGAIGGLQKIKATVNCWSWENIREY